MPEQFQYNLRAFSKKYYNLQNEIMYFLKLKVYNKSIAKKKEPKMLKIENYESIIFDFDGTLVDSMDLWHRIDVLYLRRHNQSCPKDLSYDIAGKSFTETAKYFKERFNLPDSVDDIIAEWIEMSHNEYLEHILFKPGAIAFINQLKANGQKLAIATSNNRQITSDYLKKHNLLAPFGALCFTNEIGVGKPHPAVFLKAAELLCTPTDGCLVFEDTLEGIQGAKAAGMDVIAVADLWQGEHLKKIKSLSDGFIENFEDLMLERRPHGHYL